MTSRKPGTEGYFERFRIPGKALPSATCSCFLTPSGWITDDAFNPPHGRAVAPRGPNGPCGLPASPTFGASLLVGDYWPCQYSSTNGAGCIAYKRTRPRSRERPDRAVFPGGLGAGPIPGLQRRQRRYRPAGDTAIHIEPLAPGRHGLLGRRGQRPGAAGGGFGRACSDHLSGPFGALGGQLRQPCEKPSL